MTPIQAALLPRLKAALASHETESYLAAEPDRIVLRKLFLNYRGSTGGLRLTDLALPLMAGLFKSYLIEYPEGHQISSRDIVYLERKSRLPYHIGPKGATLFDSGLALNMKLVDGCLRSLADFDPPEN